MITLPSDMDTGRATVEWYTEVDLKPGQSIRDWVRTTGAFWDGTSVVVPPQPFNPRRRLTGLALRLLAVSNAWRQP